MFGNFERMVALRYLRSRRQEGFISVVAWFSLLGIALGVATLIIVMSVMNGFRTELLTRVLGLNGHITVHGREGPMPDYDLLASRIAATPEIVAVTPHLRGQVMALADGVTAGALVQGVRPSLLASRQIIADNIIEGALAEFTDGPVIVIGERLAQLLRVQIGDKVTLISPSSVSTAFGSVPRMRAFTIAALFDVGMYEYDSSFVYMPLKQAQLFFQSGDAVNGVEVMVRDPDRIDALRAPLAEAIGDAHYTIDWKQKNATFVNALQVERNVMFLILTLIILVAAFNIISSMIMLVNDKRASIAMMRTMGASRGMVMRIFFLSGISVGIVGAVTGTVLGLVFCLNIDRIKQWIEGLSGAELFSAEIYYLSQLPAEIDPVEVVLVVSMALFLSLAASLYPAWRAARTDPIEALRHG